ncbi:MAG: ATP-binding cassette domain-containing protein [Patescibacteria group bacterium]
MKKKLTWYPTFVLQNVSKFFTVGGETIKAVGNASVSIPSGCITGIIGENGSGKTTLLHLMGGLYKPDRGRIYYYHPEYKRYFLIPYNNKKYMQYFLRHQVAWIFQKLNLISHLTVWQNIVLPLFLKGQSYKKEEIIKLLKILRLIDPERNINLMNKRPEQLSSGEQQRVAIARALVARPQVILADEPTGNLDLRNRDVFMEILKAANRDYGITVVLITQEVSLVKKYCHACILCEKSNQGNICGQLQWL